MEQWLVNPKQATHGSGRSRRRSAAPESRAARLPDLTDRVNANDRTRITGWFRQLGNHPDPTYQTPAPGRARPRGIASTSSQYGSSLTGSGAGKSRFSERYGENSGRCEHEPDPAECQRSQRLSPATPSVETDAAIASTSSVVEGAASTLKVDCPLTTIENSPLVATEEI